jgi:hypothetical protein
MLDSFEGLLSALKWPLTALIWHENGSFGRFLTRIAGVIDVGFIVDTCRPACIVRRIGEIACNGNEAETRCKKCVSGSHDTKAASVGHAGFVVSHPFAQKTANGWGTGLS